MRRVVTCVVILVLVLAAFGNDSLTGEDETTPERMEQEGEGAHIEVEKTADIEVEEFIPTREWQVVKPGQALPVGLHIRLNMMTGEKEAKLLDEETNTDVSVVPGNGKEEEEKDARHRLLTKSMEEAYKDLQSSSDFKAQEDGDMYEYVKSKTPDNIDLEELKKTLAQLQHDDVETSDHTYKSMTEIKEEFDKMNVDMQTDVEILQELYQKYQDPNLTDENRLVILEDLEYYVHQVDNARDFADMGGFSLLLKDLNHTNGEVRASAAFVMGSAAQSNPPVQIKLIELHVMQKLIHMMGRESLVNVRHKALYALATLIRHFPYAQQRFLEFGGLQVLHGLFTDEGEAGKLQVKALTLVTDLVKEQIHNEEEQREGDSTHTQKWQQYQRVPIARHIKEQGWCDVVPSLLGLNEHDYREKTLKAMTTLYELCAENIVFKNTLPALDSLKSEYMDLAKQEKLEQDEDGYFQSMLDLVEKLEMDISLKHKTEL